MRQQAPHALLEDILVDLPLAHRQSAFKPIAQALRECTILALALSGLAWLSPSAKAAGIAGQGTWETTLQGRDLDGNAANGFEAYHDTVLNITWLADANHAMTSGDAAYGYMTWDAAKTWASSLNVSGVGGWRLPTMVDTGTQDCNFAYNATDCGYNVSTGTSEMAHMFYVTLGNHAHYDTAGNQQHRHGSSFGNAGPFRNFLAGVYWFGVEVPPSINYESAWFFDNDSGFQGSSFKIYGSYAWAVRDGDVPAKWVSTANGSWDVASNWHDDRAPASALEVTIDPTRSLTVTGPAANTSIKSLALGGDGSSNLGIATLNLIGSTLNTTGDTLIQSQGILSGEGTLASASIVNRGVVQAGNLVFNTNVFENHGTVGGDRLRVNSPISTNHGTLRVANGDFSGVLSNLGVVWVNQLTVADGVDNVGTLTGNGQLHGSVTNHRNGIVRVSAGQRMEVSQWAQNNAGGTFDLVGGEFQATSDSLFNQSGGRILMGNGTRLSAGGPGLINQGQVLMSYGTASVSGQVTNAWGGQIIASGNSNMTFYGDAELQVGSELRVSKGSSVTFFGLVEQRTGAQLTGDGSKYFEGGLSVGASPGLGTIAGDVSFGSANELLMEVGGDMACTLDCGTDHALKDRSHDKLVVGGTLTLGGTLRLVSWNSFAAQAGMRFDVLDWGHVAGTFDHIDSTGFSLASGTMLDLSRLYVDGSVSVVGATPAVPEPEAWAMVLAGLGLLGCAARRRRTGQAC